MKYFEELPHSISIKYRKQKFIFETQLYSLIIKLELQQFLIKDVYNFSVELKNICIRQLHINKSQDLSISFNHKIMSFMTGK